MNPVDMGIGWAQRAVYEALTSDGGITIDSVAVPVRADVMPNQQPPYILLTNRAEDRWNVHSGLGSDVIIAVEVITRGNGHYERAQLHEIMNQVRARLDHQGIQITPQTYPPIPAPEPTATFSAVELPTVSANMTYGLRSANPVPGFSIGFDAGSYSFIGWFKPNQSTATQILTIATSSYGDCLRYQTSNTATTFGIVDNKGRWTTYTLSHSALGTDWRMISSTYDRATIRLSIDGAAFAKTATVRPSKTGVNFVLPSQGVQYADIGIYTGLLSDADIAEYRAALPMNPLNQSEWTTADTGLSPLCHYRFQSGDDLLKDGMGVSDLTLYGTGISATEHDDKHYLPPDYEPEPTPVPPETVPTINGCLFESALIIDEPDGETLRGESRYRIYLRAPSGD